MDVGTASAVVAGSFAASTPFRPEACNWAVSEIAGAFGLSSAAPGPSAGSSTVPGSSAAGDAQPTISAPLAAANPRSAPGGHPVGAVPPAYPPPAAPGGYPSPAAPSGYPSTGQVRPADPYPSFPPPPGNVPGGYQAGGGYQSLPVPGYWPQPPASGFVPATRTNDLAIASLVLGVLWLFWLGSVVGLVLGLMALKQIKIRNQGGRGIAIAGVVLGTLWLLVLVVTIIVSASNGS